MAIKNTIIVSIDINIFRRKTLHSIGPIDPFPKYKRVAPLAIKLALISDTQNRMAFFVSAYSKRSILCFRIPKFVTNP